MISYKKQKYDDIRTPMPNDVFVQLVRETLKANGVEVNEDVSRRILSSLLASMAFYLYNYPEFYIDFKKMVLYRDVKLSNLLVLESKEGESAKTIMDYYKNGGAFSEELEKLVEGFVKTILQHSTEKQVEVTAEINKLRSSKELKDNSKNKEK